MLGRGSAIGDPVARHVLISTDGSVVCAPPAAAPDIAGIGALLQAMLPGGGGPRVSGSVRYTIARAIAAAPAPPFPSRAALAAALARHQPGDPSALVRALHARATAAAPAVAGNDVERRRTDRAATELRRHLRRADEERYLLAHRAPSTAMVTILPAPPVLQALPTPRTPTRASAAAICGAAAAILIAFGAGYTTMARLSRTPEQMLERRRADGRPPAERRARRATLGSHGARARRFVRPGRSRFRGRRRPRDPVLD